MCKALNANVTNSYVFNEDSSHNKFYCENYHAYTLHFPEVAYQRYSYKKCPEHCTSETLTRWFFRSSK